MWPWNLPTMVSEIEDWMVLCFLARRTLDIHYRCNFEMVFIISHFCSFFYFYFLIISPMFSITIIKKVCLISKYWSIAIKRIANWLWNGELEFCIKMSQYIYNCVRQLFLIEISQYELDWEEIAWIKIVALGFKLRGLN